MEEWPIDWQFFFSEDGDAMDVDSGPTKPKPKSDDLSEYNLDDYDDDAKTTGERYGQFLYASLQLTSYSCWTIQ